MEILEQFDAVWQSICPDDVQFPEPQWIWVSVNGEQVTKISNQPDVRAESNQKVHIIREAFRGCNAKWSVTTWLSGLEFKLVTVSKADKKWARVRGRLASIKAPEPKKDPEQVAYERRLRRRIDRVLDDPVEQEDSFRINTKRISTSMYNFGSIDGLKKMKPVYELCGYSALNRNEYWWYDAIELRQAHPEFDCSHLMRAIKFRRDNPGWYEGFAFVPEAIELVLEVRANFEHEFNRDSNAMCPNTREIFLRACEIINRPKYLRATIPTWALNQILGSRETPVFWRFPKEAPENHLLGFLGVEKGGVEAVRLYSGVKDLPKKIAGKFYAIMLNEGLSFSDMIRQEFNIPVEFLPNFPRNWESWELFQWLAKKYQNMAMTKEHVVYGPAGKQVTFRYIDKLDELRADDLINGISTKPDVAFERAARRLEEKARLDMGENMKFSPAPFKAAKGIRQLMDSDSLKEEGKRMHNCVSGYAGACLRNVTYIFHVVKGTAEATMEVTSEKKMLQLYAENNSEPTEGIRKLAFEWAKENVIDTSDCNRRD